MLLRAVSRALDRLDCRGQGVLVAVSGGVDSLVLLQALCELAEGFGLKLSIGHVNHGLRGAESEADQAGVEAHAARLGLPLEVGRVDPQAARAGRSSRDRPSLEEAARWLRYEALDAMARRRGAGRLATAHTLDDQAETVLLRLLRGTGPDGLAGIPERSPDGRLVRPLLRVERAEVEAFARARRLSWREDASNQDVSFARNRLRKHWLPGLVGDFNPRLLRTLGNLAEAQRWDSEWIDSIVAREAAARFSRETGEGDSWLAIDAKEWAALPPALSRRLARTALAQCGAARLVTRVHLERMEAFLRDGRPGTAIELPGGLKLRSERGGLRLGPLPTDPRTAC